MRVLVWVVSILLALAFVAAGGMKVLAPAAELEQAANGVPVALLKVAGTAEVLGALGLVLPAATRIVPVLTPLAAVGLAVTMVGATVANLITGAVTAAPVTMVLGLIAAFVGWARFGPCAVPPRRQRAAAAAG